MDNKTCRKCGGPMEKQSKTIKEHTSQGEIEIKNVPVMHCLFCDFYELSEASEAYIEQEKKKHSLRLIPDSKKIPLMINRFKSLRESLNLSQSDAGKGLGCKEQYIGHIERGFVTPTIFNALLYADVLGVDTTDIYDIFYIDKEFILKLRTMYLDSTTRKLHIIPEVVELIKEYDKLKDIYEESTKEDRAKNLRAKSAAYKKVSKAIFGSNEFKEKAVLKPSRFDENLFQIIGEDFEVLFKDGKESTAHLKKLIKEAEEEVQ